MQDTFLRAYRALPGFKGEAKFSSWLYRIALNLCRDWVRRQRRTPTVQAPEGVELSDLASEQGPVESIEDLVARREMSAAVAVAMKRLPEEQRTAIVLKEYHGLTFQEIADLQGCPLSTGEDAVVPGLVGAYGGISSRAASDWKGEGIMSTTFQCDDKDTLIAFLYDEIDADRAPSGRGAPPHLRGVRERDRRTARRAARAGGMAAARCCRSIFRLCRSLPRCSRSARWSRAAVPAWAQVAAAVLVIAAGAAIANCRCSTARDGLRMSTGWMAPAQPASAAAVAAPRQRRLAARVDRARIRTAARTADGPGVGEQTGRCACARWSRQAPRPTRTR